MRKLSFERGSRLLGIVLLLPLVAGCVSDHYYYRDDPYYTHGGGHHGGYVVDEVVYGGGGVVGSSYYLRTGYADYWYDPFWYLGPNFVLAHRYVPTYYSVGWGFPFYNDYYWHYPVFRGSAFRTRYYANFYTPWHDRFVPYHVADRYGWRPAPHVTAREAVRLAHRPPRTQRIPTDTNRIVRGERHQKVSDRRAGYEATRLAAPSSDRTARSATRSRSLGVYDSANRSRSARSSADIRRVPDTRSVVTRSREDVARSGNRTREIRSVSGAPSVRSQEIARTRAEAASRYAAPNRGEAVRTTRSPTRSSGVPASSRFAAPRSAPSNTSRTRYRTETPAASAPYVNRSVSAPRSVESRSAPARTRSAPVFRAQPAPRAQAPTRPAPRSMSRPAPAPTRSAPPPSYRASPPPAPKAVPSRPPRASAPPPRASRNDRPRTKPR